LFTGQPAAAISSYVAARRQVEQIGNRGLEAFTWVGTAAAHAYAGPLPDGLASAQNCLALCGDDPATGTAEVGYSVHDVEHLQRALLLIPSGRLEDADRVLRTALTLFEQRPMVEWHAWTLTLFAHLADHVGDLTLLAEARQCAAHALRLAEDSGNLAGAVKAWHAQALTGLLSGHADEAATALTDALALGRKQRSALLDEGVVLADLGRTHLALGESAAARANADEAVEVAAQQGAQVVECRAHLYRTVVYRRTAATDSDLVEARAALAAGEALAARMGAATYAAFLAEERVRLDGGDLGAVAAGYDAIGATGHARRLQAELGGNGVGG
jgi:tetratricopeptide (TPR) repeat protein